MTPQRWIEDYTRKLESQKAQENDMLKVTDTGSGDFALAPEGNHIAICYMVVDLGQQQTGFGVKQKIMIGWELSNKPMDDGRPFVVSTRYTASLNEKANLRRDLESWRGRSFTDEELAGFDIHKVLNIPCMVQIIHNESNNRVYANVKAVTALPEGMQPPERQNELMSYSIDEHTDESFGKLHEWIQKIINSRVTAGQPQTDSQEVTEPPADFDDDIPF